MLLAYLPAVGAAEIRVKDDLNREVILAQPAKRIVALAPHMVENLYASGAGHTLVGVVDHCDYPAAAKKLPSVGSISAFSAEAILALEPDLVLVWYSGRGAKILATLESVGLTTYAGNTQTLADIPKTLRRYGVLAASEATAEAAAQDFEQRLDTLKTEFQHRAPLSVFYQIWDNPLQTLNGEHLISDIIALCGGANVFAESPALAPKVSREGLLERDPDVIVASGADQQTRPPWLDDWRQWPVISAVKHNNLYAIPPDILQRNTVRVLRGAELMCQYLEQAREKLAMQETVDNEQ